MPIADALQDIDLKRAKNALPKNMRPLFSEKYSIWLWSESFFQVIKREQLNKWQWL